MTTYKISNKLTIRTFPEAWNIEIYDFDGEQVERQDLLDDWMCAALEHIDNYRDKIHDVRDYAMSDSSAVLDLAENELELYDPCRILDFRVKISPSGLIDSLFDSDSTFTRSFLDGPPFNLQAAYEDDDAYSRLQSCYTITIDKIKALLNELAMRECVVDDQGNHKYHLHRMWMHAYKLKLHQYDREKTPNADNKQVVDVVEALVHKLIGLFDDKVVVRSWWEVKQRAA